MKAMHESDVIAYIRSQNQSPADPTCYAAAIIRLQNSASEQAVDLLIELLTYRFPDPAAEDLVMRDQLIRAGERYPAIRALAIAGEKALPILLRAISGNQLSDLAEHNGLKALLLIKSRHKTGECARLYGSVIGGAWSDLEARGSLQSNLQLADEKCDELTREHREQILKQPSPAQTPPIPCGDLFHPPCQPKPD